MRGMSLLHLLFCFLTISNVREGRIVQGIIGRNVSIKWTFNNVRNDAVHVLRNESLFLKVWSVNDYYDLREQTDRVSVKVDKNANWTVTLTVIILNVTKNDAGMYSMKLQWNSEDFNDRVLLETIDETMIPKITIVSHIVFDSAAVLECRLSNTSRGEFSWMLNGSLIEHHGRYSQNNTFLSIMNLTADDQYSLYKCKETRSGLESDPYNITISGPNKITFTPNITIVPEHSCLSVSCLADCYPICYWNWSKLDPASGRGKVIAAEEALNLQNITRKDAGMYSCRVLNKITGTSLENFTSLEIAYGPGAVVFNLSEKIIQLDENDSVTISCTADCFPPCQIGWTETHAETMIMTPEMTIVNAKRDGNYTCYAMNPRNDNITVRDSVYVIVKSGIKQYTTAANDPEADAENFPSKWHLLYILLGIGVTVTVGFLACLLPHTRTCLCVYRASNCINWKVSDVDVENDNLQEENLPGNYWTIVSNERGELTTAIETSFNSRREPVQIGQIAVPTYNESEQSILFDDIKFNEELDGYLNPIHSNSGEFDEYIHPVQSDHINTSNESIL